jgi:hypothetical protein
VATATLNSATAATASVTATVAGITSAAVGVQFKAQPTLAVVKVRTTGTLPTGVLVGGITATVIANPATGLSIAPADVSATGVGAGSTLIPNTNSVGGVVLGFLNTTGVAAGEFATLNYHIAPGSFPVIGNFSVGTTTIIDVNSVIIPGMSITIQGVTIQ